MGNDTENIIEIRASGIDTEAIMRQIRENIRQRRAQAVAEGLDYDAFLNQLHDAQAAGRFDSSLYHDLRWLHTHYQEMGVRLSLTSSPIPIIASLIQRVREAFHRLVIYYVNILAAQQRNFNSYLVQSLTTLVKELERGPLPDEIETLCREVAGLHARIERLEEELAGSTEHPAA